MCGKQSQTVLISWLVTAAVAAVATSDPAGWALDIARVLHGEWWRLAGGHFVHLDWRHYLHDLLALGLSLFLCSRMEERFHVISFTALFSACAVSMTLMVGQWIDIYGGLSGVTAGLLSFAALRLIAHNRRIAGIVLSVGMLLKICLEQQGVSASGVSPVWQAHCAGAAAGVVVCVLCDTINRVLLSENL